VPGDRGRHHVVDDVTRYRRSPVSMQSAWWLRASEIFDQCGRRAPNSRRTSRYRFAEGCLFLDCEDEALLRRFQEIYPEGAEDGAPHAQSQVTCVVRAHDHEDLAAVIFQDPEPLDSFAFCRALFPDRGYLEGPAGADGWRTIASRQAPDEPQVALC